MYLQIKPAPFPPSHSTLSSSVTRSLHTFIFSKFFLSPVTLHSCPIHTLNQSSSPTLSTCPNHFNTLICPLLPPAVSLLLASFLHHPFILRHVFFSKTSSQIILILSSPVHLRTTFQSHIPLLVSLSFHITPVLLLLLYTTLSSSSITFFPQAPYEPLPPPFHYPFLSMLLNN